MDFPRLKIRAYSDEWRQLMAYVESRLKYHRQQLEAEGIPVEKVPAIRARIAELKALIEANREDTPNE